MGLPGTHRHKKAAPDVGAVVSVPVVDYIAAELPERFAGADDRFWFIFQFKSHLT